MTAKVILDSVAPSGARLTTIEATMHRFVLAELNTHRAFSRNSASSRAIPSKKQIERLWVDPAVPLKFAAEQKGMQGGDEIEQRDRAESVWLDARADAIKHAVILQDLGVHKSVTNRLLEPFMWHTVIVSATDWDGFWKQRCSPLAQPEIQAAAEAMRAAYDASTPQRLSEDEWHTPYIQPDESAEYWNDIAASMYKYESGAEVDNPFSGTEIRKRVSVARCARVSYLTHDGRKDIMKDLELYERLVTADPPHWSPLEHIAMPCPVVSGEQWFDTSLKSRGPGTHQTGTRHLGNFTGWDQLRHLL